MKKFDMGLSLIDGPKRELLRKIAVYTKGFAIITHL